MKESQRRTVITVRWVTTQIERDRLMLSDKKLYPPDMPCAMCGKRWMQHKGELCPVRVGEARQGKTGEIFIILPDYTGSMTAFVPDENYFKEPDFDVV